MFWWFLVVFLENMKDKNYVFCSLTAPNQWGCFSSSCAPRWWTCSSCGGAPWTWWWWCPRWRAALASISSKPSLPTAQPTARPIPTAQPTAWPIPPPTPQHSPSPPPSPKFSFADGQRPSCPQATWDPELDNSQRMPGLTPENEAWLAHQKSLKSAACTSVSDDASVPSTAVDSPLDPKAASNDNMVCISDEDEPVLPPRDLANALDSAARKEESTGLMQKQNMVLGLFIYVYFPHWAPRVRRRGQFHVLKFDCLKFWWVQGIKDMKKIYEISTSWETNELVSDS